MTHFSLKCFLFYIFMEEHVGTVLYVYSLYALLTSIWRVIWIVSFLFVQLKGKKGATTNGVASKQKAEPKNQPKKNGVIATNGTASLRRNNSSKFWDLKIPTGSHLELKYHPPFPVRSCSVRNSRQCVWLLTADCFQAKFCSTAMWKMQDI